jgi:hypothetical protein
LRCVGLVAGLVAGASQQQGTGEGEQVKYRPSHRPFFSLSPEKRAIIDALRDQNAKHGPRETCVPVPRVLRGLSTP